MASQEVINALESLHKELEKLGPAITHVETALQVTQTVKEIPQKHIDLLDEVKNYDIEHKRELRDIFSNELEGIAKENKKLQKITGDIQNEIRIEQESLKNLKKIIQSFHERVEKINFPDRLDKVDSNISGIMTACQSIQMRLDSVERNITDRLKDIVDYQKETRSGFQTILEQTSIKIIGILHKTAKTQQVIGYTSLGLVLLLIILFFLRH
jgi:chromosome segregation ATPase